jgi:23S rRNA (uridine2552-2'-O)-methyltransferase
MPWLKDEKQRTLSSRTWLERQLRDPYVMRAKREGFRSRAAYKLAEIDDKYHVLKPGARVVDLGAAPGGWSEIAAQRVGAKGRVIALDILDMKPIVGVEFLKLDFLDEAAPEQLKAMLGGKVDVVLSDMAANATGHRKTDHLRIMALAEAAVQFAREVLAKGGTFVCKVLQGGTEATLLAELKRDFATVKHVKPPASRSDSAERNAGGKSTALIAVSWRSRSVISTTSAPTATPVESDSCCAAAVSAVARLISGGSISA